MEYEVDSNRDPLLQQEEQNKFSSKVRDATLGAWVVSGTFVGTGAASAIVLEGFDVEPPINATASLLSAAVVTASVIGSWRRKS